MRGKVKEGTSRVAKVDRAATTVTASMIGISSNSAFRSQSRFDKQGSHDSEQESASKKPARNRERPLRGFARCFSQLDRRMEEVRFPLRYASTISSLMMKSVPKMSLL